VYAQRSISIYFEQTSKYKDSLDSRCNYNYYTIHSDTVYENILNTIIRHKDIILFCKSLSSYR